MTIAHLVARLPDGKLIHWTVPEWMVADAKRTARDDSMPVIAVVRAKEDRGQHSAPDVIRHM